MKMTLAPAVALSVMVLAGCGSGGRCDQHDRWRIRNHDHHATVRCRNVHALLPEERHGQRRGERAADRPHFHVQGIHPHGSWRRGATYAPPAAPTGSISPESTSHSQ